MGNCLKTELKESVQNNNLPTFDSLVIHVQPEETIVSNLQKYIKLFAVSGKTLNAKIIRGTGSISNTLEGLANHSQTIQIGSDGRIWFENADFYVAISSKYDIERIQLYTADHKSIVGFDLSDLEWCQNLTELTPAYSKVQGSLVDNVGKMTLLDNIWFDGTDIGVGETIEGFVAMQVAYGRSSNTAGIVWQNCARFNETFGGKHIIENSAILTWNSATKIAIFGGAVTVADSPRVYAKGYSSEERAAWEQAGKTVTVIS